MNATEFYNVNKKYFISILLLVFTLSSVSMNAEESKFTESDFNKKYVKWVPSGSEQIEKKSFQIFECIPFGDSENHSLRFRSKQKSKKGKYTLSLFVKSNGIRFQNVTVYSRLKDKTWNEAIPEKIFSVTLDIHRAKSVDENSISTYGEMDQSKIKKLGDEWLLWEIKFVNYIHEDPYRDLTLFFQFLNDQKEKMYIADEKSSLLLSNIILKSND